MYIPKPSRAIPSLPQPAVATRTHRWSPSPPPFIFSGMPQRLPPHPICMPEGPGTFPDLLPLRLDNPAVLLRSWSTQRPTMRSNAGERPAEAGKRRLPPFSAHGSSLMSSSPSRCFPAVSLSHWPRVWLELDELWWHNGEEVGGAIQATISHTKYMLVIVGLP